MLEKIQTKTAKFTVNIKERIIEITQSSKNPITGLVEEITFKVNVETLFFLLKSDFTNINKNSIYCSTAKTELIFGSNMHLRSSKNLINTYLTKGYYQALINLILKYFPNIENNFETPHSEQLHCEKSLYNVNNSEHYMRNPIENLDTEIFDDFNIEEANYCLDLEEVRARIEDITIEIQQFQAGIDYKNIGIKNDMLKIEAMEAEIINLKSSI